MISSGKTVMIDGRVMYTSTVLECDQPVAIKSGANCSILYSMGDPDAPAVLYVDGVAHPMHKVTHYHFETPEPRWWRVTQALPERVKAFMFAVECRWQQWRKDGGA